MKNGYKREKLVGVYQLKENMFLFFKQKETDFFNILALKVVATN
jgi:hypothetical protein